MTLIRWHVQRGHVVIPRALGHDHIVENIRAVNSPPLTEAQMNEINALDQGGLGRYLFGDVQWNPFC